MAHSDPPIDHQSESWKALSRISLVDFLNHHQRPAFVLDLHDDPSSPEKPGLPTFMNPALCQSNALFDIIERRSMQGPAQSSSQEHESYLTWATSPDKEVTASNIQFGGFDWESTTLGGRWKVVIAAAPLAMQQQTNVHEWPSSTTVPAPETDLTYDIKKLVPEPIEGQRRHLHAHDFFLNMSSTPSIADAHRATRSDKPNAASTNVYDHATAAVPSYHEPRSAKRNADLLTKIAAFEAFGIYFVDIRGEIIFCNDAWYNMTQHPRDQTNAMAWTNVLEDEEVPKIMELWSRIIIHQEPIRYEARLKRPWKPPTAFSGVPTDFPACISGWTYPDVSPDGETVGVYGVMTDISEQKWTEHLMEQKLAHAVERASLVEQLSLRAKQVADTEERFRRLSDMMPSAIWMSDAHGNVIYANEAYHNLVPRSRGIATAEPWWEMIPDDQIPRASEAYRQLMVDHKSITFELAFRKYAKGPDAPSDDFRWMLVSAYPALHEDGQLNYITGCLTDISDLKLAEQVQGARALDALESKRKLEHFIDMTSHEMRNPLSAIIHSAEEILSSLRGTDPKLLGKDALADTVEAAEIIIYCADHSTRIVDDILLVSKLESGLLTITPTDVQPVPAIKQAFKMFDGEMRAADIMRSFTVDQSLRLLHVDWVNLDMSRVLQVFVNLVTNAIKFTRPESIRQISTTIKASTEKPSGATHEKRFPYLDPQTAPSVVNTGAEVVYISVTVSDTGCGLTEAEQKNLFLRFSQGGKRTHVKYGGTGLGLFISRQLCEMQGGQIGLQSTPNKGSTFSFYVVAYRTVPPESTARRDSSTDCLPRPAAGLPKSVEMHRRQSGDVKVPSSMHVSTATPNSEKAQATLSQQTAQNSPASASNANLSSSGDGSEELLATSHQHTILLVEDNLVNQKVVAKKLRTHGFTVLVANHGVEALDRISESALWFERSAPAALISLVLLDMEMPVMDGLSCIRRIRELENLGHIHCHVPVIAVTANARQEQIEQAKEAGMDDVVTKPFRMNQLFITMAQLVEKFPTRAVEP